MPAIVNNVTETTLAEADSNENTKVENGDKELNEFIDHEILRRIENEIESSLISDDSANNSFYSANGDNSDYLKHLNGEEEKSCPNKSSNNTESDKPTFATKNGNQFPETILTDLSTETGVVGVAENSTSSAVAETAVAGLVAAAVSETIDGLGGDHEKTDNGTEQEERIHLPSHTFSQTPSLEAEVDADIEPPEIQITPQRTLDIRNFFIRGPVTSSSTTVTSLKRKFECDSEDQPASKKLNTADSPRPSTSSESSSSVVIAPSTSAADLKTSGRQLKLVLTRLEDTDLITEDLKKQLEELKEAKKTEGEQYEVEAILDYSWCKLTHQGLYQVKWLGWPDATWEPLRNLEDCQEALKEFYIRRLAEREKATPAKKRFLEVPPDPRTGFERRSEYVNSVCAPPCHSELEAFFQRNLKKPIKLWPEHIFNVALDKIQRTKKPNEAKLEKIKEQIMLRHVRDKRKDQLERLKEWEAEINQESADNALLRVENDFDLEGPPRHMTYINEYMPAPGIVIPNDPPLGCECENCEIKNEGACCPGINGHIFPYTRYGKIRVHVGTPIFECNKRCKCGPKCTNRVVQKGRQIKLCIYRTSNGCGWGVKTLESIKKGSFVVEYVGEVITSEEAEDRGKKYDAEGKTYLFDLDFNLGENNPYTVDAAFYGNVAHFINHSCEPNLQIYNVWIDCLDPNLPRLCFFAARDIAKGEAITFDYRQQTGQVDTDDEADPEPKAEVENDPGDVPNGHECRCGAEKCRKIIF